MSDALAAAWESGGSRFDTRRRARLSSGRDQDDRLAVLVVDDEETAAELAAALAGQPVELRACPDPADALLLVGRTCPDVILLGPARGRLDPLTFLSIVRAEDPEVPIVVGADADGFATGATGAGATVVVPRPYRPRDLLALLRSFAPRPEDVRLRPMAIDLGRLRLDGEMPRMWLDGVPVLLPPMEFLLLRCLAERVGAVVTRDELIRAVWGAESKAKSNTLTVHIMRLRKRLGDDEQAPLWIRSVRGLGYLFTVPG